MGGETYSLKLYYSANPAGDAASLGRLSLSQLPCQTLPHPFVDGAALLAIGSGTGSLLVLELVGKAEPVVVLKTVMPGNMPIVGLGMLQVGSCPVLYSVVG